MGGTNKNFLIALAILSLFTFFVIASASQIALAANQGQGNSNHTDNHNETAANETGKANKTSNINSNSNSNGFGKKIFGTGNFSLSASGNATARNSTVFDSTFDLNGTFQRNGNSGEFKLKDFNGTLTIGNETFDVVTKGKGQGQVKLKNGRIMIEAQVRSQTRNVKGELQLIGKIDNLTSVNGTLNGTFSSSLVGALNLNKGNHKFALYYTNATSTITFV